MPGLEGTTLGRYRLLRRLGRGGMSEVYLAYDESMHREVAIKVVSSSHADYLERFHREAEAIGRLHHDHILPAYDYGEQGPWHYLVMPYIGHGTLRDRLESSPLTLEDAGEMLEQIASALQTAHDAGIIHRDIKPSNILLRDDHYAYLADFGLAKAVEGGSDLTQTGTLLGTPEYMAPELAEGPATTTSDLYALGILLYEMVTGRVPFSGDTPISVFWKQIREQPTPPSRLQPHLPRSIEQVILRALEKDPLSRYPTALTLAQAYLTALAATAHERLSTRSEEDPYYAHEIPSIYDTSEIEEPGQAHGIGGAQGQSQRRTPEQPLRYTGGDVPLREDQLVLPANPIPLQFEDPTAQTIIQEPARPMPQYSTYPRPPASIPRRPRQPSIARRRRRRASPALIGSMMGIVVLLIIFGATIVALNINPHGTNSQGTNATATARVSASGTAGSINASATQQAQASATAGVLLTTTSGTPIFADPLSSNTNNWSDDGTKCAFMNGTYHVLVQQANFLQLCESSAFTMDNDTISVDVSLLSGNNAGMIFRVNGTQFYDFEITNTEEFFFRRHDSGTGANYQYLIANTKSSAIAPGSAKNTLVVIANGSDFKLYINGTFVGEQQDSTYSSGQIGFVAGTLPSTTNAEGSFANLQVFML